MIHETFLTCSAAAVPSLPSVPAHIGHYSISGTRDRHAHCRSTTRDRDPWVCNRVCDEVLTSDVIGRQDARTLLYSISGTRDRHAHCRSTTRDRDPWVCNRVCDEVLTSDVIGRQDARTLLYNIRSSVERGVTGVVCVRVRHVTRLFQLRSSGRSRDSCHAGEAFRRFTTSTPRGFV